VTKTDANIVAAVGANGHGKTLWVAERVVLPAWQQGLPVYSNLRLYPEAVGYSADLGRDLEGWRQLDELRDCVLVLDEITSVFPSRQSNSLPPQLARRLNQLRKRNVTVAWTAPAWQRADLILREVTQAVTICRGFAPDRYEREPERATRPRPNSRRVQPHPSAWLPRRLFSFTTYDAKDLEEAAPAEGTATKAMKPLNREWYWRPWHDGQFVYSTLEDVALLDHLDDVGVCISCGGTRLRKKCACVAV
jgi:Zonular occludens toxin (Zot)